MRTAWNLLLAAVVVALVAAPLLLLRGGEGAAFVGSDSQAEETITDLHPDYTRWAGPVWEPPSKEVETLLFTLQAAAGTAVLGYVIGYLRGRAVRAEKADAHG